MKPGERILGVEGGGTKTAWVIVGSCQSKLIAPEFSLPVAPQRKIAVRSSKSVSRSGQMLKSLRVATATPASQRRSIMETELSSTLEAVHRSLDAEVSESKEPAGGDTSWATLAAVIFFPFRRFV